MHCFQISRRAGVRLLSAALLLLLTGLAAAQTPVRTVGFQGECDFGNLQDAVNAAADAYPETWTIRVNKVFGFTAPLLALGANVVVEGGYTDCGSDARTGFSNLSGRLESRVLLASAPAAFPDRPSVLTLRFIQVLDGHASFGAGISVNGGAEVRLEDSHVIGNVAALLGGGIDVRDRSTLRVSGNSRIEANEAGSETFSGQGAGINCEGSVAGVRESVVHLSDGVRIVDNQALRGGSNPSRGGGFYLRSCGLDMSGGVEVLRNRAVDGGGGYLRQSKVRLSMDETRKTMPRFEGNQAKGIGFGGALYLTDDSTLEMNRAAFISNDATIGGALYLNGGSSFSRLNDSEAAIPPDCPHGILCPRFVGNQAMIGALASVGLNSKMELDGVLVAENIASNSLVDIHSETAQIELANSLMVRNPVPHITDYRAGGYATLRHNTITDNPGLKTVVSANAEVGGFLEFSNNLVMEHGVPVVDDSGALDEAVWRCHVGSSPQQAPFDREVIITDAGAGFKDPENLDYHLGPDSEAIDACDNLNLDDRAHDIDGEPRPIDHPSVLSIGRHADAGADEVQVLSNILFSDRFEQQDR